ncbi:MAG: hypothetical protein H0S82_05800 [Anaerolineaceae bacterium]|nr:hypothetical protein [Anaerolineaceae bacterium]
MMSLRKLTLLLISLILIGTLTQAISAPGSQTASAQEAELTYLPLFSHIYEPLYSTSYYMITIDPEFTYSLGCELGTRDQSEPGAQDNVVVLDFGYPVYSPEVGYGAALFGFGPVGLSEIRIAAENFARGYYTCTGSDNDSNLVLGVGTNNKPSSLDTAEKMTAHGTVWARMVNTLNQTLLDNNMLQQVQAYGASDIELGWNSPANSIAWLTGYGSLAESPMLYYGDAAGCPFDALPGLTCGTSAFPEWTMEDVWYVSWGFEPSLPLPLIYLTSGVHAQQWAFLSQYAYDNHGARMDITGVFTQWQACEQWHTCNGTDNTPSEAYWQLYNELNDSPDTAQELDWKTDIRWILREEAYPEIYGAASQTTGELPTSLTGLMADLSTNLQSRAVTVEAEALLTSKLDLLSNLAEKMTLSAANPAPKDSILLVDPQGYAAPTFTEGIVRGGEIAGLPYGAEITTVWQSLTDSGYLQIGAGQSQDYPGQGALFIQVITTEKTDLSSTLLVTDELSGSLEIIEVSESGLLLQSASGSQYFYNFETNAMELLK